jgi:hypothetical protein
MRVANKFDNFEYFSIKNIRGSEYPVIGSTYSERPQGWTVCKTECVRI